MFAYCVEDIVEEFNTLQVEDFTLEDILSSYVGVFDDTLSMVESYYSTHKKDTLLVSSLIEYYQTYLSEENIMKTGNDFYFLIKLEEKK